MRKIQICISVSRFIDRDSIDHRFILRYQAIRFVLPENLEPIVYDAPLQLLA